MLDTQRLVRRLASIALLLLVGCSDGPTSLLLTVTDPTAATIEPIAVSVFDPRGALPLQNGVPLQSYSFPGPGKIVIGGLDGGVKLRVLVRRVSAPTVSATGRVQTRSGEQVTLALALADQASADRDGDGIPDEIDNCPDVANETQADGDGNGTGEACEGTADGGGADLSVADLVGVADLETLADLMGRDLTGADLVTLPDLRPPTDLVGGADLSSAADLGGADLAPVGCGVLQLTGGSATSPSNSSYTVSAFTLEAWIRPSTLVGDKNILGHWGVFSNSTGSYGLYMNGAFPALGFTCNGATFTPVASSVAIAVDQWAHVAAVFDGTDSRIYVNGVLRGTVTQACAAPHVTTGIPFQIAYDDPEGGNSFLGYLDEARLSSVVRYTGSSFTPPASLTSDSNTEALFHFEGTGTTLTDSSPQANHATLTGSGAQTTMCR